MALHTAIQNRPVHLARRDACFERAMELLNVPAGDADSGDQLLRVRQAIDLMHSALDHARLAGRLGPVVEPEEDFLRYLALVIRNIESAAAFLENEAHLAHEDHSFLTRFLGVAAEESGLSALNYRRWGQDILMGLYQQIRMAHGPYRTLQQINARALSPDEQARYALAFESFQRDLASRYPFRAPGGPAATT